MKKSLVAVLAGLASAAAFAGMNNVVVSFSTPGPDKYADGTTVVDGECYALVWTPSGSTFSGIKSDGTAAGDSKVVIKAPVAKDGKCPRISFQIDEDYRAANYPDGVFGVYLLDTRVYATDSDGIVQKDSDGNDVVKSVGGQYVKGYGAVGTTDGSNLASVTVSGSVAAGTASAGEMKITDISVNGDNVYLTVTGANAGKFELKAGDAPQSLGSDGNERSGNGDDEMIIVRPKKSGGEFFQVNRK